MQVQSFISSICRRSHQVVIQNSTLFLELYNIYNMKREHIKNILKYLTSKRKVETPKLNNAQIQETKVYNGYVLFRWGIIQDYI